MRTGFGAALGLLVLAGTVFTGRPLDTHALGGLNTVTVSPTHGKVTASFQVTYAITPCASAAGLTIGFSWGALTPGGPVLGTATTNSACRATLSTAPPLNTATHQPAAAGVYQVFAYVALPTGAPTPGTDASASYTVDVTPAPSATASASPTVSSSASASASATARPTGTAKPSAGAPGGTAASPSASGASTSDQPVTFATPQSTGLARSGSQQPWWTLGWTLGGVLVIAIVILILVAFLAAWLLRRRRTDATALRQGKDRAA